MKDAATFLLTDLAEVFSAESVRWYLFGAQAVNIWGRPRMTADVDVTVGAESQLHQLVPKLLAGSFEAPFEMDEKFLKATPVAPLIHTPTRMPLDIVHGRSGLEDMFLNQAREVTLGGVKIPVVAPGDLLVLKLIAGRPKDLDDARTIVLAQKASLDVSKLRNLLGEVEEALAQSDLIEIFDGLFKER